MMTLKTLENVTTPPKFFFCDKSAKPGSSRVHRSREQPFGTGGDPSDLPTLAVNQPIVWTTWMPNFVANDTIDSAGRQQVVSLSP